MLKINVIKNVSFVNKDGITIVNSDNIGFLKIDDVLSVLHISEILNQSLAFIPSEKTPDIIRNDYNFKIRIRFLAGQFFGYYDIQNQNQKCENIFIKLKIEDIILIRTCLEYIHFVYKEDDVLTEGGSKMSIGLINKIDKFLEENKPAIKH